MDTMTTLPHGRPLTRADLDVMPDDGHRYELLDGSLIVTPAPSLHHQRVVGAVFSLLRGSCPPDLEAFVAPVDVVLADGTVMQPDVLVARRADLMVRDLPAAPVLAVEVLSPSTRHVDLMLKRSRYEAAGCPSYWVVDPDEPSVTAWDLRDGHYVETGHVVGEQEYVAELPYAVLLRPAALLEG